MDRYEEALERAKAGKPMDEVFPELKESEDERIRKMLLDMCDDWEISKPCRVDKGDVPGVRAWLKNRKPAWTEEDESFVQRILPRILDPSGWTLDQQNADREQLKKFIDNFKGRYVVLNPIFRVGDAMRTLDEAAKGIKDGLPYVVSIDSEYYICNNEKIRIADQGDYEFPPMNRKQSAEWSEEDEKILERFLGWLQGTMGEKTYSSWLKSLHERFNIQPKQEWSEEDEKTINEAILRIEQLDHYWNRPTDEKLMERLKSLRPQQKQDGVWITKEQFEQIKSASYLTGKLDHWKPSEEQMCELNWASKLSPVLESLYNDLKKL